MDIDLLIVLGVLVAAAILHPGTETKLHRAGLTLRFWRNGYDLRRAWRLSEKHL